MKGELNKDSTFTEIEKFFVNNAEILPATLDGECRYYMDVKFTVETYIYQVHKELDRLGVKGVRKSAIARSAKQNLFILYVDLCNVEGWDQPMKEISKFHNKMY